MKFRFYHIVYFFAALLLHVVTLQAQQVQVAARIDSTSMLIGNQTVLRLTAAFDVKNGVPSIQWPQISDSLIPKVEVISKSKVQTIAPDSSRPTIQQEIQDITITSFDSGYYAIPPFRFIVNGDTSNPLYTQAMMLQVNTVHVDTTKAFKDIKAPMQAKFSIIGWLLENSLYIGGGLVVLIILAVIVYYYLRKMRNKQPMVAEEPKVIIPAHVKALQELEKLLQKKLWQEGKIKEYYTGITDILRVYLSERYDIGALEMTTDEIMLALKRRAITEVMKEKLSDILILSDLVKFAKENPLPADHEFCYTASVNFIQSTAEMQVPPNPPEQKTATA